VASRQNDNVATARTGSRNGVSDKDAAQLLLRLLCHLMAPRRLAKQHDRGKKDEKKKKRLTSFEKRISLFREEPNEANIFPGLGFKGEGRGHTSVRSSSSDMVPTSCI
jgi:hypothetical protein